MTYGRKLGKEMIVFIELQFDEWQHQSCNNGIIQCVKSVTNEDILIVATQKHIDALSKENITDEIDCYPIDILGMQDADEPSNYLFFNNLIKRIINCNNIGAKDTIILLSSSRNGLKAVQEVVPNNIRLILIQHANLEYLLRDDNKYNDFSYKRLFGGFVNRERTYFVTFSPNYGLISEYVSKAILKKFVFMHIPVTSVKNINFDINRNRIGVYGQCVNRNFRLMLKYMLDSKAGNIERFLVLMKTGIGCNTNNMDFSFSIPAGLPIVQKPDGISCDEQIEYIKKMKWILLPYSSDMYRVSASGIFADAIKYGVPILSLNSPYIAFYEKYGVGIIEKSIDKLADVIEKGIDDEIYENYCKNIATLRMQMTNENMNTMKSLLYD